MTTTYDAIVIGAGHNGLVTAASLARAGWRVLVLERNGEVGGAVRSGEITRPGWVHDLYATNQNLFLASPVYAELKDDLERHGLRYAIADKPYCNLFPGGRSLRAYKGLDRTRASLAAHDARDAEGWDRLAAHFERFQQALLPLYQLPLPSMDAAVAVGKAVQAAGVAELTELAQILLSSTRELGDAYFHTPEAKALLATWGLHLDSGPDVSGGSIFAFLETFTDAAEGMAIAVGGASHMPEALAAIVREHGGEIRTHAAVRRVLVEGDRAVGAELDDGTTVRAERAVVANLVPSVLFQQLLPDQPLPDDFRRKVRDYQYGPATMMLHLALDGPPEWAAGAELREFAYLHLAPYVDDLARCYTEAQNGLLPANPLLIVGQTTAVDPSRAPDGGCILWIQVRPLPREIRGDAAGEIGGTSWDAVAEAYAERVLDKLEDYAPGVRERIVGRAVVSPAALHRSNPNLVGGDSIGGSHHLRQNLLFRPFPGWSTYAMPLEGLYMVGAATWPGAGTNGTSGHLAAQQLLHPHATRDTLLKGGAAVGAAALGATLVARWLGGRRGAGVDMGEG